MIRDAVHIDITTVVVCESLADNYIEGLVQNYCNYLILYL